MIVKLLSQVEVSAVTELVLAQNDSSLSLSPMFPFRKRNIECRYKATNSSERWMAPLFKGHRDSSN